MSALDSGFTIDDFNEEESSVESTTETTTEVEAQATQESAESTTEPEAEKPRKEAADGKEGDSGAESPNAKEYSPDFSYKIKDDQKEFPDWAKEVIKSKEDEETVRDLFTKADALDSIKESRDRVETQFNEYQQNFENQVLPTLQMIDEFDKANATKDFGKAWELSSVDPKDVVDYMLMDEGLSDLVYKKVLDQINAQEQGGPQVLEMQKKAFNESRQKSALELQNRELEERLARMEQNSFNQSLNFVMNENQDSISKYESINGQGSFKQFVEDYNFMQKNRGKNLTPVEAVNGSLSMLGLNSQAPQAAVQSGTNETTITPAKVEPQAQKTPEALPNLGTGSNVSMVQEVADTWDKFQKSMGGGF